MKSPKWLLTTSVMGFALLLLPGCAESGMRADQDQAEIPAGTQLHVRLNQNLQLGDDGLSSGDEFQGTLERALEVNGQVIAPEGTIVKGEFTSNLGSTGMDDVMPGQTGTGAETGTDAGNDRDRAIDTGRSSGDPTMGGTSRDRLGLELNSIVLNGEEHDIDTHAVPIPGMTADQGDTGTGIGRELPGGQEDQGAASQAGSAALSQLAGQQFVFTLEEAAELPLTGNMRTE